MKKIILLSAGMLCSIFILVSFSSKNKATSIASRPAANIINCITPTLITAAAFEVKYQPNALMVRKNVDALTTAEINAIKVGLIKMKALPYTNPTSWIYQVAIHSTTLTDNLPSWNSCHQVGQAYFFLAWHRMYIFFFERILRAKSGRANLTLPYWNYQINPVLNAAYRDNSPGNPLYDATRNPAINSGGELSASIMTAFSNSLDLIPFYTFQSNLNGPHGSVHTAVNGNMANVITAAKDPVFWLHHSNIDRLWEEWLSKCGGRATPIDTSFLNTTYTFFDEIGTPVSMRGSQVVQIATQLNYKYDVLPSTPTCPASRAVFVNRQPLLKKEFAVEIKGETKKANFIEATQVQLESFIKTNKRTNFNFSSNTESERLVMTFNGIKIGQMPQGVVEVYLNLPAGVTPTSTSKYFVGLLDLFSSQHIAMHALHGIRDSDEIELDATKVAQALGLTLDNIKNTEISFVVRGCKLNGIELKTEAQITIPHIQFSIDKYRN